MAKENAAAEAPKFAFGTMTFAFSMDVAPTLDKAGSRATPDGEALPFADMFTYFQPFALDGKQPSFFVPTSLWQARSDAYFDRLNQPSKKRTLSSSDNKSKLRDIFKKWQGDDVVRKTLVLGFATRTGKENIEGVTEPGVTVWVMKAAA